MASPDARVGPDAPPFFVIHGANDSLVPVEEAHVFVEALRSSANRPVFYAELPGVQHAFDVLASPRTLVVARGVHRFLESVRSGTTTVFDNERCARPG